MSSAPFPGRSLADVFGDHAARGIPPRKVAAFGRLVAEGMDPDTRVELCGWVDSPKRHEIAATLPFPSFAAAAPDLMAGDTSKDVFLYKAWKDVLGSYPSYPAQQIGDCTSFGSGHTLDLLQCIEIATGAKIEYRETCTEAIYGMGREVAGMLGGGDGCMGTAVAKAISEGGVITREKVGPYSGQRAKQWGGRGGVPDDVKKAAAEFKGTVTTLITTLDEHDAALANGYPSAGGFGEGFSMHRDADGVCRKQGRWGHEVGCSAKRTRNGRKQYLLDQSWGNNVPDGPTTDEQPSFSFWISAEDMAGILAQRDWLTFSLFSGFIKKDLPDRWSWESMA